MWLWVSLLNAISAFVSSYLMDVLRKGHHQVQVTEERLREFLEGANDLIFSVRPDGKFLYANRAWERVLGQSSQPDLFAIPASIPKRQRNLQVNGLAFLWELSRRNPYATRIVTGAPLGWCERLASRTLVQVLACARRSDLAVRRFPANAPVYQRVSAHMATLQSMLTAIDITAAGHLPAAACRMSAPARQVADKL